MMTGTVFDIQRMSVHDGPGIRTTVFLKGCPLNCLWCHNPESKKREPVLAFYEKLCIGCGDCAAVCPNGCHRYEDGVRVIDREACECCGECEAACTGALKVIGKTYTVEQVMEEVRKDLRFYRSSDGGMTVSGGEPLLQAEFATALLQAAKRENLHTCVETAGHVPERTVMKAAEYTDLFLFDVKETDPQLHRKFTGADNGRILKNLFALDQAGYPVILRCPIVPGCNDREEHLKGIAGLANRLRHVQMVHIEPYNSFGEGKSGSVGMEYALKGLQMPEDETISRWISVVQAYTEVPVVKS